MAGEKVLGRGKENKERKERRHKEKQRHRDRDSLEGDMTEGKWAEFFS